ncbi:MAG: hypothetical protein Q8L56_05695 [Rhodocyclaceae bacterium]|nr:hypothetical protein [Rhodocyclaceae bacterium]
MRLAFLILLLANVLLFAWGQGHLGTPNEGREPERLSQQLTPEKLRIVPAVE